MLARRIYLLFFVIFLASCSEDGGILSPEEKIVDEIIFKPQWKSINQFVWTFEYDDESLKYFNLFTIEIYDTDSDEVLGHEYKIITLYNGKLIIKAHKNKIEGESLPLSLTIKRLF